MSLIPIVDGSSPLRAPKIARVGGYIAVFSVILYRVVCWYVDGGSVRVNFSEMLARYTHSGSTSFGQQLLGNLCDQVPVFLICLLFHPAKFWSSTCSILWDVSSTSKAPWHPRKVKLMSIKYYPMVVW